MDATQEQDALDVSEEVQAEESEAVEEQEVSDSDEYISPREKAMEAIAIRHEEGRSEEFDDVVEQPEGVEEIVDTPNIPDAPVWHDGNKWMTKIKVDGEEHDVPFNDLQSSHQKDKASQKRFEQAAMYGQQLQQKEQQLRAMYEQMQRQQPQPPSPSQAPDMEEVPSAEDADLIKQYHEALYEDDQDKAANLLKTLTNGRSQATPNVEEVVDRVLGQRMAQQQAESARQQQWAYQKQLEDAVHWFNDNHPNIANTPELRAVANDYTVTLTEENPNWTPMEIIQESAKRAIAWAEGFTKPEQNNRVSRKKKIVQQPKSANASISLGDDGPAPQTVTEIIEEMKKQRGQTITI